MVVESNNVKECKIQRILDYFTKQSLKCSHRLQKQENQIIPVQGALIFPWRLTWVYVELLKLSFMISWIALLLKILRTMKLKRLLWHRKYFNEKKKEYLLGGIQLLMSCHQYLHNDKLFILLSSPRAWPVLDIWHQGESWQLIAVQSGEIAVSDAF